jgi:hypothetical protein
LDPLLTFYSGTPFTVYTGKNTSGTREYKDRAEVVSDPFTDVPPDQQPNYAHYFNPAAFQLPAQGTYANQPRNEFYGPPNYRSTFQRLRTGEFPNASPHSSAWSCSTFSTLGIWPRPSIRTPAAILAGSPRLSGSTTGLQVSVRVSRAIFS